jgi:hypothetical protein
LKLLYNNIRHYADIKKQFSKKLLEMQNNGVKRVAFFGVSDEMEIAYITLQGSDMKLVGIGDEDGKKQGMRFLGHKVLSLGEVKDLNPDAILIASTKDRTSYVKNLLKQMGKDGIRIFTI